MDLFSRRVVEKMCLSISRPSRKPVSAASMRGRLSNMRKSPTRENYRQKISRFNADLAESKSLGVELRQQLLLRRFPRFVSGRHSAKKVGDCPIGSIYRPDKSPTS